MPSKYYFLSILTVVIIVCASCASNNKPQSNDQVIESPQPLETALEPGDDISFLNGTIWEYETQIGDFTAWRCISIDDNRATYYMRMGNAIDADPNTAAVYLKGDIITFSKDDGSAHSGQIIGDTILLDGAEIYTKLP